MEIIWIINKMYEEKNWRNYVENESKRESAIVFIIVRLIQVYKKIECQIK